MIDPKRSLFKKITKKYNKDCIIDIIDIEEAITKNKIIENCKLEDFIYSSSLKKEDKEIKLNLEEYVFEFDNGRIKYFSEYYQVIDVIGRGSFGIILSAKDLSNKNTIVAIKVYT